MGVSSKLRPQISNPKTHLSAPPPPQPPTPRQPRVVRHPEVESRGHERRPEVTRPSVNILRMCLRP